MTGYSVTPTQQGIFAVLAPFIISVTGLATSLVIQGLGNRVAMPAAAPGFVVMQLIRTERLRTNIDTWTAEDDPTSISSEQGTKVTVQLDCYGQSAGDWAVMLSTLLRDEIGCDALAPTCQPLYTEGPFLAPLDDSEAQYEQRWTVTAQLQYNPVTTAPMQFANELSATLIDVNTSYPPS